jgi:prepilin-type N-terminal cleavage/methylation domain-containing protein
MSTCPDIPRRRGFTLVEMLVAVAVLSLMLVALGQLLSDIGRTVQQMAGRLDNYTKARAALDVFARDVREGVFRSDLAAFPSGLTLPSGDPAFAFYTRRPGVGANTRDLSLVAYGIDSATGSFQRGSMPIRWGDAASLVSFNNTTTLPEFSNVTTSDMADGVMRMGVYFVNNGGGLSKTYTAQTQAVGVTLAVVDAGALKVLSASQLQQLTSTNGALPDDSSATPTQTLGTFWQAKMAASGFFTGYPQALHTGLHVYERYVPLSP